MRGAGLYWNVLNALIVVLEHGCDEYRGPFFIFFVIVHFDFLRGSRSGFLIVRP
jgi:hypothetical protein